jgi:hypothetical protein
VLHRRLWVFGNEEEGKCGHSRAWRGRVVAAEVTIWLANVLRCMKRQKAEGKTSLDCGSWETGVVVVLAELVDE